MGFCGDIWIVSLQTLADEINDHSVSSTSISTFIKGDYIYLTYFSAKSENTSCRLYGLTGNLIQENIISTNQGLNNKSFPIGYLDSGFYLIELILSEGVASEKIFINSW